MYCCVVFPDGCDQYNGANDIACYQSIWNDVGCTDNGLAYPSLRAHVENMSLHLKSIGFAVALVCHSCITKILCHVRQSTFSFFV